MAPRMRATAREQRGVPLAQAASACAYLIKILPFAFPGHNSGIFLQH